MTEAVHEATVAHAAPAPPPEPPAYVSTDLLLFGGVIGVCLVVGLVAALRLGGRKRE
mgnify:CR=1 FL=1